MKIISFAFYAFFIKIMLVGGFAVVFNTLTSGILCLFFKKKNVFPYRIIIVPILMAAAVYYFYILKPALTVNLNSLLLNLYKNVYYESVWLGFFIELTMFFIIPYALAVKFTKKFQSIFNIIWLMPILTALLIIFYGILGFSLRSVFPT